MDKTMAKFRLVLLQIVLNKKILQWPFLEQSYENIHFLLLVVRSNIIDPFFYLILLSASSIPQKLMYPRNLNHVRRTARLT